LGLEKIGKRLVWKIEAPPGLGLEKVGKWLVWTIWWLNMYMQTAAKYSSLYIHHPGGASIIHTSHFPIFSRPKPGGGVYLWGPKPNGIGDVENVLKYKGHAEVAGAHHKLEHDNHKFNL